MAEDLSPCQEACERRFGYTRQDRPHEPYKTEWLIWKEAWLHAVGDMRESLKRLGNAKYQKATEH